MTRVEWTRQSGEDIEAVIAMFISAEFPNAERITPSQGDGGIDVMVRRADGTQVYQVKKFTGALTASHKRQIRRSVERLATDPRLSGLTFCEWHLAMPRDPTLENKEWLTELVTSRGLPDPTWDGLTRCDLWAAKYPHIVDYYLHGGRERITEAASNLVNLMRLRTLPFEETVDIRTVSDWLQGAVGYLNHEDPFYNYGITVLPGPAPDLSEYVVAGIPVARPGCVYSSSWGNQDMHVTVEVYPKNRVALDLSPIKGQVQFTAQPDSVQAQALLDFARYGSPMTGIDIALSTMSGPVGLAAGSLSSGVGTLGPPALDPSESALVRLVLIDPDHEVVSTLLATRKYAVHGQPQDGRVVGGEVLFVVDPGASIRVRFDMPEQRVTIRFSTGDVAGRVAVELIPMLRFLAALGSPNSLTIAERYGPLPDAYGEIPQPPSEEVRWLLSLAECLAAIQDLTATPIRMPDPEELDQAQLDRLWRTSQLAKGETLYANAVQLGTPSIDRELPSRASFAQLMPWRLSHLGDDLDLGFITDSFEGILLERGTDAEEGSVDVWEVVDKRIARRRATASEITQLPGDLQWLVTPIEVTSTADKAVP